MKRQEIETKIRNFQSEVRERINIAPVASTVAAFILGAIFILLRGLFIPLLILAVLVVAAIWIFAEEDRPENAEFYEPEKPLTNGSDTTHGHRERGDS